MAGSHMSDNILLIFPGLIFLVAGFGVLFARSDKLAKEKDEKRFGPLSPFNTGGWYLLIQNKSVKFIFIIVCISLGVFLVVYSLISTL
jgi:hypothetical protein